MKKFNPEKSIGLVSLVGGEEYIPSNERQLEKIRDLWTKASLPVGLLDNGIRFKTHELSDLRMFAELHGYKIFTSRKSL